MIGHEHHEPHRDQRPGRVPALHTGQPDGEVAEPPEASRRQHEPVERLTGLPAYDVVGALDARDEGVEVEGSLIEQTPESTRGSHHGHAGNECLAQRC